MRRLLALASLLLLAVSALPAQTVYSTTNFSGWFLGTKPSITGGDLVTQAATTNAALVYFEAPGHQYTMSVGETLTLSANFTMASGTSVSSSRTFYLTLQNSNSTLSTNNQVTANLAGATANALFGNYTGYGLLTNPGPSGASAGQFDVRSGTNTNIAGSTTPWVLPSSLVAMTSATFTTDSTHNYNISYTIKDVSSSEIDFTYTLTNLTTSTLLASYSGAATGLSGSNYVTSFDTIALGVTSAQTGSFKITDLSLTSITSIPEPSAYAVAAGILAMGFVAWRRRAVLSRQA